MFLMGGEQRRLERAILYGYAVRLATNHDYTEAVKWYRFAAQQGHEYAQKALQKLGETW